MYRHLTQVPLVCHRIASTSSSLGVAPQRSSSFFRPTEKIFHAREQPTHGFYILYPEVPEEKVDENALLSTVVNDSKPPFRTLQLDKCLSGTAQIALNCGGIISEEAERLDKAGTEMTFSSVFDRILEEMSPMTYAWVLTRQLYQSMLEHDHDLQLHNIHRVGLTVSTNQAAMYNETSIYKAALELQELPNLTEWQQRFIEKVIVEGRLSGLALTTKERHLLDRFRKSIGDHTYAFMLNILKVFPGFSHTVEQRREFVDAPLHVLHRLAVDKQSVSVGALEQGPWCCQLNPASLYSFMRYCENRDRRQNAWQAWTTRAGFEQPFVNNSLPIEEMRYVRTRVAQIVGFDNVVEMSMHTKMAQSSDTVIAFLDTLRNRLKPAYIEQRDQAEVYAEKKDMITSALLPSDMFFYGRKHPTVKRNVNEVEMQRYFPYKKVMSNLMDLCANWFNVAFVKESTSAEHVWHDDVSVYKVMDTRDNHQLGTIYLDAYARPNKATGWEATPAKCRDDLVNYKPMIFFNMAAIYNTQHDDAFLHWEELEMLMREFGRSMMFLCSQSPYAPISGMNFIEWDALDSIPNFFVHLLHQPTVLCSLSDGMDMNTAVNYAQTMAETKLFETYRSLFWSEFDIRLWSYNDRTKMFWLDLYRSLHQEYFAQPADKRDCSPCNFAPIFAGQWTAAYYSSLWSEMLACDMIAAFKESNAFADPDAMNKMALKLRESIIDYGGGRSAKESFRAFRGRDPSVEPIGHFYAPLVTPNAQTIQTDDAPSGMSMAETVKNVVTPETST